jgi:RND family efflux transporter MFP subunit
MKNRCLKFGGPAMGLAVIVGVIVWQAGGCRKHIAPGRIAEPKPEPPQETLKVVATNLPVVYTAVGTLRSRTEVDLASRIVGRILAVNVRIGDRVKANDALVTLDEAELRTALNQAKERASAAQAAIASATAGSRQARSALDLATTEAGRYRTLFKQKAVSQQTVDTVEDALRQAEARMAQAEQNEIGTQATLRAAQEAQRQTETVMGYAAIASPMDGIVSERLADPGDMATPGNTLIKLFDPTRLLLETPIREGLVARIKVGDHLPVTLDALGKRVDAEVREIVPSVDAGSRTFLVKLCLPPTEGAMPGLFGTVALPLEPRPALLIPNAYLIRAGQLEYVTVLSDNHAQRVLVRTARTENGATEVLAGLHPGDTLVRPK